MTEELKSATDWLTGFSSEIFEKIGRICLENVKKLLEAEKCRDIKIWFDNEDHWLFITFKTGGLFKELLCGTMVTKFTSETLDKKLNQLLPFEIREWRIWTKGGTKHFEITCLLRKKGEED
jgi:hypothetical protein